MNNLLVEAALQQKAANVGPQSLAPLSQLSCHGHEKREHGSESLCRGKSLEIPQWTNQPLRRRNRGNELLHRHHQGILAVGRLENLLLELQQLRQGVREVLLLRLVHDLLVQLHNQELARRQQASKAFNAASFSGVATDCPAVDPPSKAQSAATCTSGVTASPHEFHHCANSAGA